MIPPGPLALLGALDSLWIMVLLALGSAVVEWLQRRRQRQEGKGPSPDLEPPPGEARPVSRPEDWQEELRRLLEGEESRPKPQAPPQPPVVIAPASPSAPPTSVPPLHNSPAPSAPPVIRPTRPVVVAPPRPVIDWEAAEAPSAPLAQMRESAAAHSRASSMVALTLERLRAAGAAGDQSAMLAPPRHLQPPPRDVVEVHAWLRHPRTARQAVMASVILGPPRGLDLSEPV